MGPQDVFRSEGGGVTDCTPCCCSDPVTSFALKEAVMLPADPLERLLPWPQDAPNELMNHSGTPRPPTHQCLVEGAEGGRGRGGGSGGVDTKQGWVRDSGGRLYPKSKFGEGSF